MKQRDVSREGERTAVGIDPCKEFLQLAILSLASDTSGEPGPLFFFGIDLLQLFFCALKLPAAFITMIKLHIEVLGLIVRIFFGQPDTMIGGDIPDRIVTTKWAVDQIM
jgi:hypothetical protein